MKRFFKVASALLLAAALAFGAGAPAAFAASAKVITGTVTYTSSADAMGITDDAVALKGPFRYSDAWFAAPSTQYHHELARMSLTLQKSSWTAADAGNAGNQNSPKLDSTGRTRAAAYVHRLYKDIGFTPLRYVHYGVPLTDESDKVAWAMAEKLVTLNGKACVILSVTIRGGLYGGEWVSNGNVGDTDAHAGFKTASEELIGEVEKQISSYANNLTVKLWINGYSRSGAVGNLLAGALDKAIAAGNSRLAKDDLFCYNYAVPLCTKDKKANSDMFSNIFNIINPVDVIMIAPFRDWGFRRYGVEKYLNFLEPGPEADKLNAQYAAIFKGLGKEEFKLHLVTWDHFKVLYLIDALVPAFMAGTADLAGFQEGMMNLIRSFFVQGRLMTDIEAKDWANVYADILGADDPLWHPASLVSSALVLPINAPAALLGKDQALDPALLSMIFCALTRVGAVFVKRPPNPLHIAVNLPGVGVSIARFAAAGSVEAEDGEEAQGFTDNIKVAHSTESYTVLMGRPESEAFGDGTVKGMKVT